MKNTLKLILALLLLSSSACTTIYTEEEVENFEKLISNLEVTSDLALIQAKKNQVLYLAKFLCIAKGGDCKNNIQESVWYQKSETLSEEWIKVSDFLSKVGIDIHNVLEEDSTKKNRHALSFISNANLKIANQGLQSYFEFLEKDYPKAIIPKIKSWKKYQGNLLRRELEGLPLIGAKAKLMQIHLYLKKQENAIYEHIYQKLQAEAQKYQKEKIRLFLSEEQNKVKLGQDYKARLIIGTVEEFKDFEVIINGQEIPTKNGVATLKTKAKGLGKHKIPVKTKFQSYYQNRRDKIQVNRDTISYEVIPRQ